MPELIIYPDPESVLVGYLTAVLDGAATVTTRAVAGSGASSPKDPAVTVSIIGGGETASTVDAVTVNINSAAEDWEDASALAALVRAHMAVMPWECTHANVLGTTENARPVPFPDPVSGIPSYRQQHEIRIRGLAA